MTVNWMWYGFYLIREFGGRNEHFVSSCMEMGPDGFELVRVVFSLCIGWFIALQINLFEFLFSLCSVFLLFLF